MTSPRKRLVENEALPTLIGFNLLYRSESLIQCIFESIKKKLKIAMQERTTK